MSLASEHFLSATNLLNVARQAAPIVIVGVGMTLVMATAGIDLSVGSIVAVVSVVSAAALDGRPACRPGHPRRYPARGRPRRGQRRVRRDRDPGLHRHAGDARLLSRARLRVLERLRHADHGRVLSLVRPRRGAGSQRPVRHRPPGGRAWLVRPEPDAIRPPCARRRRARGGRPRRRPADRPHQVPGLRADRCPRRPGRRGRRGAAVQRLAERRADDGARRDRRRRARRHQPVWGLGDHAGHDRRARSCSTSSATAST